MTGKDAESPAFFAAPTHAGHQARTDSPFFSPPHATDLHPKGDREEKDAQPQKQEEDQNLQAQQENQQEEENLQAQKPEESEEVQARKEPDEKELQPRKNDDQDLQAQAEPREEEETQPAQARKEEKPENLQAQQPEEEENVQARQAPPLTSSPASTLHTVSSAAPTALNPVPAASSLRPTLTRPSLAPAVPHRQALVDASVSQARRLTSQALAAVRAARAAARSPGETREAIAHYQRWFGRFTPPRAALVENIYQRVHRSLLGNEILFLWNCRRNWYAYVRRGDGQLRIWLCRLFLNKAGDSGYNSRPGALIHELAHRASTGVLDHAYGVPEATDLAGLHPPTAVHNADNYAYFAEANAARS